MEANIDVQKESFTGSDHALKNFVDEMLNGYSVDERSVATIVQPGNKSR